MLPGFRFLFAALVLSMSALVFGFGAAALLRTAHEEFASTPALYAPPETTFAQVPDTTKPVLAMLRVDDPPKESVREETKDAASDAAPPVAPAEPTATAPASAQPEQTAALQPVDQPPAETAKTEPVAAENPPQPDAAPAPADASAATDDVKVATTEPTTSPVSEAVTAVPAAAAPVIAEQTGVPTPSDIARSQPNDPSITTRIATLGGPPVEIAREPVVKAASAKPDTGAAKKHTQAQQEHKRRRISARARLARQAQQPADPFAPQPTIKAR